jgi:hypothetical protein
MCVTFVRLSLILEYTKLINMLGRSLTQTLYWSGSQKQWMSRVVVNNEFSSGMFWFTVFNPKYNSVDVLSF